MMISVGWLGLGVIALSSYASAASPTQSFTRQEVTFNFGWRFIQGDPPQAPLRCTPNDFTMSGGGCELQSLIYTPLHTAADCRRACCPGSPYHPACKVWAFCNASDPAHYRENVTCGCYLGGSSAVCPSPTPTKIDWRVGHRNSPWPPQPPASYATPEFDDSNWDSVQAPHDFVIYRDFTNESVEDGGAHGYLPRDAPGWYRKKFILPSAWRTAAGSIDVFLRFHGVFHVSEAFLDGKPLALTRGSMSGYTNFVSENLLRVGDTGAPHVLAIRVDASYGSGHWYEGGGLYRDVYLVAASRVRVAENGLNVTNQAVDVEITNTGVIPVHVTAKFNLMSLSGSAISAVTSVATQVSNGNTALVKATAAFDLSTVTRWSVQVPAMYVVSVSVIVDGVLVDSINVTTGFRSAEFTSDSGFHLNGERLVLRGFSDHNSLAGVGAAIPQRLNLYRAQMLRAIGMNIWRMSHNPGDPATFDVLDALGVLSWDENRDYSWFQVGDMTDMVKRDRTHPSIVAWSLCNEIECTELSPNKSANFRAAVRSVDTTRPVTANLLHDSSGSLINNLDLTGVSHASTIPPPWTPLPAGWYDPRYSYEYFHKRYPNIPLVSSESTSCNTQRGVNYVNTTEYEWDDVFNGDCLAKTLCPPNVTKHLPYSVPGGYLHAPGSCTQSWTMIYNETGNVLPFMAGSLGIWTGMDYIGEPSSSNRVCNGVEWTCERWPQVSCNYGSFDLCGFAKPAAFYYRAWWLAAIPDEDVGKPPLKCATPGCSVVKIVHDWREPAAAFVAVYSNLPTVELFLNGESKGRQQMGWANWTSWEISFVPGNLTAVGYAADGSRVTSDASITPTAPSALLLSLDAPSEITGTGSSLSLDGQDAALVRLSVVDSNGVLVTNAPNVNVSFSVLSGPGAVVGTGNGDPTSHEPNKAAWRTTYHGLARAVVQTTLDTMSAHRDLIRTIDVECSRQVQPEVEDAVVLEARASGIVVQAVAAGFKPTTITIPVSNDPANAVLAVARRSVHADISIE